MQRFNALLLEADNAVKAIEYRILEAGSAQARAARAAAAKSREAEEVPFLSARWSRYRSSKFFFR